ncbi:MAG TPA: YHS domain-containing protein [Terriglobales bacterium]|nr:YHS domain-containing protein [Terriglobales bacterium]
MKRLNLILAIVMGSLLFYLTFASLSVNSAENKAQVSEHQITKQEIGKAFTCPLCGMDGKVAKNTPALDYKGMTYYFCSAGEKKSFSKNPEKYVVQENSATNTVSASYSEHKITKEELGKEATCPVTKKSFKITKDTPAIDFQGKTYYFCCPGCVDKFMASQTGTNSPNAEPDSIHHNQSSCGAHKHKGCC